MSSKKIATWQPEYFDFDYLQNAFTYDLPKHQNPMNETDSENEKVVKWKRRKLMDSGQTMEVIFPDD